MHRIRFTVHVIPYFFDFLFLEVSLFLILQEMFVFVQIILVFHSNKNFQRKIVNYKNLINHTSSSVLNRSPILISFSFKVSFFD